MQSFSNLSDEQQIFNAVADLNAAKAIALYQFLSTAINRFNQRDHLNLRQACLTIITMLDKAWKSVYQDINQPLSLGETVKILNANKPILDLTARPATNHLQYFGNAFIADPRIDAEPTDEESNENLAKIAHCGFVAFYHHSGLMYGLLAEQAMSFANMINSFIDHSPEALQWQKDVE